VVPFLKAYSQAADKIRADSRTGIEALEERDWQA